METKQEFIWVEKWRPTSLDTYIGSEKIKEKFAQYITAKEFPHILLTGKPGTGKSTIARILMNSVECDKLIINASDENNVETMRGKIRNFAMTQGFSDLKVILLEEFDYVTPNAQAILRQLMEQFSSHSRFILTGNYVERIIDPIISRSQHFTITPPSMKQVAIHVARILQSEGVTFKPTDVKTLVESYFPDIRKVIGECQSSTVNGVLSVDTASVIESDIKLKIIGLLATVTNLHTTLTTIRQLIADSKMRDFSGLYTLLYEKVLDYTTPATLPEAILAINEGQFRDGQVVDKEINAVSTILTILRLIS